MTTKKTTALDVLMGLPLEDGTPWGAKAHEFQLEDVRAILDPAGPRRHALLRGRGMSKSSDIAGLLLALLVTQAPERSRSLIYASDTEQAGLFADALAGFIARSGLSALVESSVRMFTNKQTGASISVESSDGASAFGARPWFTVLDEFSLWPSTGNYRRLSSALLSAVAKVPGGRLVMIGTAGSPVSLGHELWETATSHPEHWRTAVHPGPSPWWTPEDVEATRASLTESDWARLIECRWQEGEDSLTSPEDVQAAIRAGVAVLPPHPGTRYVAALDVGTRRDLTALSIGHAEQRHGGLHVVVDRVVSWSPADSANGRVDLAEVEATTLRLCREYRVHKLRFDRMQAEQLAQNLGRAGLQVQEYVFSSAGANRVARGLFNALRDRALELPDDATTREQFLSTRLVETGPGVVKLANPVGHHDDIPTTVGMIVAELTANPHMGGQVTVPRGRIQPRAMPSSGSGLPGARRPVSGSPVHAAMVRAAVRNGPRLPSGVRVGLGIPGAWDDPRRGKRP